MDMDWNVFGPDAYEAGEQRITVKLDVHGLELLLFFQDWTASGPVLELRLLPGSDQLESKVLRRLIPQAPLLDQYARAAIHADRDEMQATVAAYRMVGRPGRGLPDEFFKAIATSYRVLVAAGEEHPVKAIGELHHGSISAASRWISEAERRGHLSRAKPDDTEVSK